MKQRIVPIAAIVSLIYFSLIICHKEINRHNDVQTVQPESAVTKICPVPAPVFASGQTASIAEIMYKEGNVAEDKTIAVRRALLVGQTNSTTETTPWGDTSLNGTQTEVLSISEPKNFIPAAVPVVTAEEAEKLNAEAIEKVLAEKEKREPFFHLYENVSLESITFEGTIRATSAIPDPAKNDYDDCLYALFIELDSFFAGDALNKELPCEAIIAVPVMKDKAIIKNNIYQPGDKVICTCAEYDAMPQSIQEIQFSDDIQSFEHQQYYVLTINRINTFSLNGSKNFAKRKITILPIRKLQKDETIAKARAERIQNEIRRIEKEIEKHGGSFDSWKEEYKTIDKKYKTLCSEDWKGWINDSFFYAKGPETSDYKTKEYIEGIMPYKKYLDENNIDLVLIRYPSRADFAARVLGADDFQENPAWIEHYYECLKNDIEIVDPMPEMWEHRFDYPLFYFYNLPSEQHPFEGEIMIAAKVLSKVLERYSIPKEECPITLHETTYKSSDPQYFYPPGNPKYETDVNITFNQSVQNDDSIRTLQLNSSHPVLFLSNSFLGGSPIREVGASVPAYLSFFLQTKPDWFYQSGIENAMIRNLISSPELLANRQVVVMVAAWRMWPGAFPPFPKYISDNAKSISLEKTMDFLSSDISIVDNDSFVFSKNDAGATVFTQNTEKNDANKNFKIELSIPPGPDEQKTCMLRINYIKNKFITMNVTDNETGQMLDTTTLALGANNHADVFIPVSDTSREISIQFMPSYPENVFSIKNIELWYY